jgi:hypothetical protein
MGARFLPHCSDMNLVKSGLERIQREFAPAGFSFENRLAPSISSAIPPVPHFVTANGDGKFAQRDGNVAAGTPQ